MGFVVFARQTNKYLPENSAKWKSRAENYRSIQIRRFGMGGENAFETHYALSQRNMNKFY